MPLTDKFGRAITDLRISITDRCNYKCVYCRTGNEGALYGDMPFSEYLRMARIYLQEHQTQLALEETYAGLLLMPESKALKTERELCTRLLKNGRTL